MSAAYRLRVLRLKSKHGRHLAEKAIKQAIQDRNAALWARDVAAVMASGAAGFVSCALAAPLKSDDGKADLAGWFAIGDGPIAYELTSGSARLSA